MGTIQEKLAYLNNTKTLIRNAIIDKGVPVSASDTFRSYAEKIGLIQGGSSGGASLNLGPYAEPTWNYSFSNPQSTYPTISAELPKPADYVWPEDWWNIEEILDADTEDYPAKMIVLYPNNVKSTILYGANFYRTSDGTTYTSTSLTQSQEHVWDTAFDKVNSDGMGYRYVISYFSAANGTNNFQQGNNTVNSNAIAIITKGFRWQQTTTSSSSSGVSQRPFNSRYQLQYVKTKDSDWSDISYLSGWFTQCYSLEYVELDFNNGVAKVESPSKLDYMFNDCRNLKYVKFSMPFKTTSVTYMFNNCSSLQYVDIDWSHKSTGIGVDCSLMFNSCSALRNATISFNPKYDTLWQPWIQLKSNDPLKVSKIAYKNARDYSSSSSYQNYQTQYPVKEIEIEASNDGENWVSMGQIKPKLWTQLTETSVNIDPTNAYMYWRFRATKLVGACFTAQSFVFTAQYEKTTMEGDEEVKTWVDWIQPNFSSVNQDNCSISTNDSSGNTYYAFNNNNSYGNYWRSNSNTISGDRCISLAQMFYACGNLDTVYIKGGNKVTWYDCRNWSSKYIIFENTDSVTTFVTTFSGEGYSQRSSLLGCIIPNTENVTSWNKAFYYCSNMTVAPQIKISSKVVNVDQMFGYTKLLDVTHLDVSEAVHCRGLLREIQSGGFTELNMEFPEATELSCLFYSHAYLTRANIVAPKVRTLSQMCQGTSALNYIKISGYNQEENATVLTAWSRPNLTSDTSYGTLTKDSSLSILDGSYLYKMFDGTVNTTSWGSSSGQVRFSGSGSIYWELPEDVKLKINTIHFTSGFSLLLNGQITGRFYADKEKTIPLTDEFSTDGSVWNTFDLPVIAPEDTRVTTLVLDIISVPNNYGTIGEITFDAEYEASGYMINLSNAFRESSVAKVDLDASKVKNMSYAFYCSPGSNNSANSSGLLDIPDIGYDSVENLDCAFYGQEKLTELNQVEFPVATSLNHAFRNCKGLISIDKLSLPECTSMSYAFEGCASLGSVSQPQWPKVTNLSYAFSSCSYLKDLDISNLELVSDLNHICYSSNNLAKAKMPATNAKTNMTYAFTDCNNLRQVTLGDMSNVTDLSYAFENCYKLVSVSELALNSCTTLYHTFKDCHWLETISISNLDAVTTLEQAFYNCYWLASLSLPDMPLVTTLLNAFRQCSSLASLTLNAIPKCTSVSYMCQNCSSLSELNLADTSAVTNFSYMLQNCSSLETVSIPSTAKGTDFTYMFDLYSVSDPKLKTVNELDVSSGTTFTGMFRGCKKLISSPVKSITSKATTIHSMYERCISITDWSFLDNYDVSKVTDMSYLFRSCQFSSMTLDKWNWNASVQMPYMFDYNPNLESLTLDFKNIGFAARGSRDTAHAYMFQECPKLKTLNILNASGFNCFNYMFANTYFKEFTFNLENFSQGYFWSQYMFANCPNLESVILNYNGVSYRTNGSSQDYSIFYRIFQNCPKLKSISLINVDKVTNWFEAFAYMNNKEDCTINWNGATISNPYMYNVFTSCSGADGAIKHVNMNAVEETPGINAFNGNVNGYCSEPMYQEAQIDTKLPFEVQIQGLSFTQRANAADAYEMPNKARFYSDSECQTPISAEMILDTTASSKADIEVSDVVTDRIVCKFGQEFGRYIGAGQIGITAKAKGITTFAKWEQPILTSNTSYGNLSCSSYWGTREPWHVSDGVIQQDASGWGTNASNTGWLKWEMPAGTVLTIKGIKVVNRTHSNATDYQLTGARFYTDDTKTVPIGDEFSIMTSGGVHTVTGIPEEGIQTSCIYFYKTGSAYSGLDEIYIDAYAAKREYLPWSTPEESWTEEEDWIQSVPVSNDSIGTISASSEGQEAYKALKGTESSWISTSEDTAPYWQWVLPETIHGKMLTFQSDDVATCQLYSDEGATPIGDPIEQNLRAWASNFSTSNRYEISLSKTYAEDEIESLEFIMLIRTGSSWTSNGRVIQAKDSRTFDGNGPFVQANSASIDMSYYNNDGSLEYPGVSAVKDVRLNTEYYVKFTFNKSENLLRGYYSEDRGKTWILTEEVTPKYSPFILTQDYCIGNRYGMDSVCVFTGALDMNSLIMKVNDEIIFQYSDSSQLTSIGSPALTEENSGFLTELSEDISTLRIKPLTRLDSSGFGIDGATASINSLVLKGTHAVTKTNVIDFQIGDVLDQLEISTTPAKKTVWSSDTYQGHQAFYNMLKKNIYIPACFSNIAYQRYLNRIDTTTTNTEVPITVYDLDFYAPTVTGGTPLNYISEWFSRSSSNIKGLSVLMNPKNIVNSINLSALALNRDSLISVLNALMSRVGTSQATLTIGSTNLNQLTEEDKKIATDKNWKLA